MHLDILQDKSLGEVEEHSDEEVGPAVVDEARHGVAVELAGDDAHLGHVLDRPAILASTDLRVAPVNITSAITGKDETYGKG